MAGRGGIRFVKAMRMRRISSSTLGKVVGHTSWPNMESSSALLTHPEHPQQVIEAVYFLAQDRGEGVETPFGVPDK